MRILLSFLLLAASCLPQTTLILKHRAGGGGGGASYGFEFRDTSGYVTTASGDEPVLGSASLYPTSFFSGAVTAGWYYGSTPPGCSSAAPGAPQDIYAQDPRVSGDNYISATVCGTFRIDVPAGTWKINLAMGRQSGAFGDQLVRVYDSDDTTLLATIGPGNTGANTFMDASGSVLTYSAWTASGGAQITVTTTGSSLNVRVGGSATTDYQIMAYLRVSQ